MAEKLILHAALGGLIAKARGESFASGAIAGGVAEGLTPIANVLLAEYVSSRFDATDLSAAGSQLKIGTAQIIGLIAAGVAGGNPETGSQIGGTAEKYNDQGFHDPTDWWFDDSDAPLPPATSAVDKLKAEISLFLLTGLFPGLLAVRAEGWLARLTGMFSESTEGAALAGAGTKAGAGGIVDVGIGSEVASGGAVEIGAASNAATKEIKVVNGFYEAEGTPFKFSEYYYKRLWSTGRGGPFVQEEEVFKIATTVTPDRMAGFYRYTNGSMEMVYNPATKEVWHIQPLR